MKKQLLVICVVLGFARMTSATPLTFFGEDTGLGEKTRLTSYTKANAAQFDFLANLEGVGSETFENFTNGASVPLGISFPGAGSATISGDGSVREVKSGTNGVGRYAVSGSKYFETGRNFAINFSDPVAAFGFYGVDVGDFKGQLTVTATTAGGLSQVFNVGNSVNSAGGGVLFFGLIDSTNLFTKITFGNTAAGIDYFGFDNLIIGSLQQVKSDEAILDLSSDAPPLLDTPSVGHAPEPSALVLFGSGLLGLAYWRKRKAA